MKCVHLASMIALVCLTVGCSSYYRVTDPSSGRTYYSKKVDEAGKAGAIKFKDERTGSHVTLQSSDVREISADDFKAGLQTKSTPGPTPPTAAPASQK
jgi:hypothetical protein